MTLKLARFREHHRTGFSQAAELNLPDKQSAKYYDGTSIKFTATVNIAVAAK
jgi:hypothetical protein